VRGSIIDRLTIAGVQASRIYNMHVVEFCRGYRFVRISMWQVERNGEPWAMRKLFRFRRYAKRMERQA